MAFLFVCIKNLIIFVEKLKLYKMNIDYSELALKLVHNAFKGKTDKAGAPYVNHLLRVAEKFKDDPYLYPIALLHDLIEDCAEWNETSLGCIFPRQVVETVMTLTKGEHENYFDYIERVRLYGWATTVKISDLRDNMDITRLEKITEKDHDRLNMYLKAFKILTET